MRLATIIKSIRIVVRCTWSKITLSCVVFAFGSSQAARGSSSSFKSDRAVVTAIERLVEFERRYLREMNLNDQADKNVNVRGRKITAIPCCTL